MTAPLAPPILAPPASNKEPPAPPTEEPPSIDTAPPDDVPVMPSPPSRLKEPPLPVPEADRPPSMEIAPPADTPEPSPASIVTAPPAPVEPAPLRINTSPPTAPLPLAKVSSPPTVFLLLETSPARTDTEAPSDDAPRPAIIVTLPDAPDELEPLPTCTEPDDTGDAPLDTSTSPLPLWALDVEDKRTLETPDKLKDPPEELSTDVVLAPADTDTEPPSAPAPADIDNDPPRLPPLEPADKVNGPADPEAAFPVITETEPLTFPSDGASND